MIERDPVVLVHDGDVAVTGFLLPLLARRGPVVHLELDSVEGGADALLDLLDDIRTAPVTLLGHGLGVEVAVAVAARRAEVSALVLIQGAHPVRDSRGPMDTPTLVVGREFQRPADHGVGELRFAAIGGAGGIAALTSRPAEVLAAVDAFLDGLGAPSGRVSRPSAAGSPAPAPESTVGDGASGAGAASEVPASGAAALRGAASGAGASGGTALGAGALRGAASGASASGTATEHADVVIVGAGFAGLGMGIRLQRQGARSFLILERGNDVGGTWRDNTYPGVACDIPSHLYSFSFRPKPDWSRFCAPGAEIQEYLRESAREEGLLPHIRFGTDALDLRFDEAAALWRITTNHGSFTATNLVMAAGRLADARLPAVDGLAEFTGRTFHSSRWDHGVALEGARVGVVGTGASAVQMLPHIAARASQVVLFQRTPAYVLPRDDEPYSPAEQLAFAEHPRLLDESRTEQFWQAELGFPQRLTEVGAEALTARATAHRERQVSDPALREQLRPGYSIGCKRALFSNDFYPALMLDTVTLEPSALDRVDGSTAVSADGHAYDIDVLVFATGFESTRPPFAERVVGRNGVTLAEHWSGGMTAYASTVVHGFPNFFVVDGPNASLGHNSAIYMIETQIEYILGALAHREAHDGAMLEVSADAERAYTAEIDRLSADTVWTAGGCTSWYLDDRSGRLTLLWPDFAHRFRQLNGTFDPGPFLPGAARTECSEDAVPAPAVCARG